MLKQEKRKRDDKLNFPESDQEIKRLRKFANDKEARSLKKRLRKFVLLKETEAEEF